MIKRAFKFVLRLEALGSGKNILSGGCSLTKMAAQRDLIEASAT